MKFCYECGYKLEGYEKFCPECGKRFDGKNDAEEFIDSIFNQFIGDMEEIKKDAIRFLDDFDLEDMVDDLSINSKKALNRDIDYIIRARKKLNNDSRDFYRVITLCDRALAVNNRNWEAYHLKGIALFNLERYSEAIEEFINSLALNEENLEARVYIARSYFFKGNEDCALKIYDSILNQNEKYFEALKGKALVYYGLKDYFNANEYFNKANNVKILDDDEKYKWDVCIKKLDEE